MTDFNWTKSQFHIPNGVLYLNGNSLGPLPKNAAAQVARCVTDEWGEMLITGWNKAGWMQQPSILGDRIARLIGAQAGHVVVGDTLSIKVFQALDAALQLTDRKVILSDTGNFPSDLYMAEGFCALRGDISLRCVAPEKIEETLSDDTAVLMLTEVDYRTGRRHDMQKITQAAAAKGVLTIWDLAHSAGATDVDLTACNADFAIGCTYKFLNAGPGSPAFIYIAPRHAAHISPALSGWLGHRKPFDFDLSYAPANGVERLRIGTPAVLQMAALEAALDVWDHVDMGDVRRQSIKLSEYFIDKMAQLCPTLKLVSPRDAQMRGSHISFSFEHGYAAMQACIERGVIGDFRAPNIMRFGIAPLYLSEGDLDAAAQIIAQVINDNLWDNDKYKVKKAVT